MIGGGSPGRGTKHLCCEHSRANISVALQSATNASGIGPRPKKGCSFGNSRAFRKGPGTDQHTARSPMRGSPYVVAVVPSVMGPLDDPTRRSAQVRAHPRRGPRHHRWVSADSLCATLDAPLVRSGWLRFRFSSFSRAVAAHAVTIRDTDTRSTNVWVGRSYDELRARVRVCARIFRSGTTLVRA